MESDHARQLHVKALESGFSGTVALRLDGVAQREAFGCRDRANGLANGIETRFGIASGTKGFTAVAIGRLIDAGDLGFDTKAAAVLGARLKGLHPQITIGQLLGHRSGMGDYYDEVEIGSFDDFELAIPVHKLEGPFDYAPLIEAMAQKFEPGARFSYCNSGYIVAAMIVELLSGMDYGGFVEREVFQRAQMPRSGFFRTDCLPCDTAVGYLGEGHDARSNIYRLPVRGGGDGGAYSTVGDMERFWAALKGGQLLREETTAAILRAGDVLENESGRRYGMGFWMDERDRRLILIGCDAGVSFVSTVRRDGDDGFTVVSNTSKGAWPIASMLAEWLAERLDG